MKANGQSNCTSRRPLVQTVYFKLTCILAGLLLWLGYRLRVRFLTRTLTERLGAQMEVRQRIASDLHETVLQTFQGFVLKVTTILPESEAGLGDALRRSLRDATSAILKGRDKIAALRAGVRNMSALSVTVSRGRGQRNKSAELYAGCLGPIVPSERSRPFT